MRPGVDNHMGSISLQEENCTIRGSVLSDKDGSLSGATVKYSGPSSSTAYTMGYGDYEFSGPPGTYHIVFSYRDHYDSSQTVTLVAGQNLQAGAVRLTKWPPPQQPQSPSGPCHPSHATVELRTGPRRLDSVNIGDHIRVANGDFEPIVGFLHAEDSCFGEYNTFVVSEVCGALESASQIEISDHHWLFVNGAMEDPSNVYVGDILITDSGNRRVVKVTRGTVLKGAFHPIVPSGAYFVNGILASDYNCHVPQIVWRVIRAYIHLRYTIGLSVLPQGQGVIRNPFWLTDGLDACGVPAALQAFLFPVHVPIAVFTEILNSCLSTFSQKIYRLFPVGLFVGAIQFNTFVTSTVFLVLLVLYNRSHIFDTNI